jgi:hypothetical protein
LGEFETFGFSIGVLSEDIALFHALYRTSILGRKNFIDYMFSDDNDESASMKIKDVYVSRVAEVFSVIMKSLGMAIRFVDERAKPHIVSDSNISAHRINEKVYICSDYQFYIIQNIYDIRERILQKYPIITKSRMDEMLKTIVNERDGVDDAIVEDLLDTYFKDTQELIDDAQKAIQDAVNEFDSNPVIKEEVKEDPKTEKKPRKTRAKKVTK